MSITQNRESVIAAIRSDSRIAARYAISLRNSGVTDKVAEFSEASEVLEAVAVYLEKRGEADSYDYTPEELEVIKDSLVYAVAIHELFISELLSRKTEEAPS